MKFTVVIPSRLSSSRLQKKALQDIGGKPMVIRVAESAKKSNASKVLVATDHLDILNICQKFGVEARMTSDSHESGTERLAEIVDSNEFFDDDIIVNVQGDEPMIDPELINYCASKIDQNVNVATSAHKIIKFSEVHDPNVVKVILNKNDEAIMFSRASIPWSREHFGKLKNSFPVNYFAYRHIGIYAYKCNFLKIYKKLSRSPIEKIENLEQLRILWHGYKIAVYISHKIPIPGVDTEEDLERIREYFVIR